MILKWKNAGLNYLDYCASRVCASILSVHPPPPPKIFLDLPLILLG